MAQKVFVKKITVEYAAGGKRFKVDFTSDQTKAIVFTREALDMFNVGLEAAGALPETVRFVPTKTLEEQQLDEEPGATSRALSSGDITRSGEDLWWLTDNGWFHPPD